MPGSGLARLINTETFLFDDLAQHLSPQIDSVEFEGCRTRAVTLSRRRRILADRRADLLSTLFDLHTTNAPQRRYRGSRRLRVVAGGPQDPQPVTRLCKPARLPHACATTVRPDVDPRSSAATTAAAATVRIAGMPRCNCWKLAVSHPSTTWARPWVANGGRPGH